MIESASRVCPFFFFHSYALGKSRCDNSISDTSSSCIASREEGQPGMETTPSFYKSGVGFEYDGKAPGEKS